MSTRGTASAFRPATRRSALRAQRAPTESASVGDSPHVFSAFLYKEFRMKCVMSRMWKEEDGVLSFEWVLLVTLLTFGIVSGLAGARDAIIDELGDVAQAMLALD